MTPRALLPQEEGEQEVAIDENPTSPSGLLLAFGALGLAFLVTLPYSTWLWVGGALLVATLLRRFDLVVRPSCAHTVSRARVSVCPLAPRAPRHPVRVPSRAARN